MRVQTFSVVVGTEACNSACPFCISRQTTDAGVPASPSMSLQERMRIDRNFQKACRLAQLCGCVTTLFTGKGEPTLFPDEITGYLRLMEKYDFPRIELQTNGIKIAESLLGLLPASATPQPDFADYLKEWYNTGLTTIALSIVHWNDAVNKSVYAPNRSDDRFYRLADLTRKLHEMGFFVRWSVTMLNGYVCNVDTLIKMIAAAKDNKVEQLTLRKVMATKQTRNPDVNEWVEKHALLESDLRSLMAWLDSTQPLITKLMTLSHGATVYDVSGQNVCLTDCMTAKPESDDIRTLIFFPDGQTRYDWRYEGAVL